MATLNPSLIGGSTPRSLQGYASEVYAGQDASLLPQGLTVAGVQLVNVGGVNPGGVTITDLFSAILTELRGMHATLQAMRSEPMSTDASLQHS